MRCRAAYVSGTRGKVVRDAMAEKHKTTFDKYVNFACHILWTERRNWGDTFEDFALECYRRETAKRRKVFLRNLIGGSEHLQIIRDVVNRIGQADLGKSRRAPPELEIWMAKTAVLKRPVLTARGRDPNTNRDEKSCDHDRRVAFGQPPET